MSVQTPLKTALPKRPQAATISRGTAVEAHPEVQAAMTADDVKAMFEARLQSALDQAMSTLQPEEATPYPWWDILAFGPFQNPSVPTNKIIRAGHDAYLVTVMILNPFYPSPLSACKVLSDFALPYEITYQTGNLTTWQPGPSSVNVDHDAQLQPGQCFYVDVLCFRAEGQDEVLYETNISARIFGCSDYDNGSAPNYAPDFAGFAREVVDFDSSIFLPYGPGLVSSPIRWMVYGERPPKDQ